MSARPRATLFLRLGPSGLSAGPGAAGGRLDGCQLGEAEGAGLALRRGLFSHQPDQRPFHQLAGRWVREADGPVSGADCGPADLQGAGGGPGFGERG